MNPAALQEAIDLAGGTVTVATRPAVLPLEHFASITLSIDAIGQAFHDILARFRSGKAEIWGAVALTQSTAFGCRVKPIGDDGFVILAPIGLPARLRVLSRLLLSYWTRDSYPRFIRSALDNVPGDREAIPPGLRPLFLEEGGADYWDRLLELDAGIALDEGYEADVKELVHLGMLYLLSHEFIHILHGHFDLLKRVRTGDLPMTEAEVRRGIEVDADDGAAAASMYILNDAVQRVLAVGGEANLALGWLRLTYTVAMIFAVSDAHRKFFGAYDARAYNHPMVRCELFFDSATRALGGDEAVRERWHANSSQGWVRAVQALENLTLVHGCL